MGRGSSGLSGGAGAVGSKDGALEKVKPREIETTHFLTGSRSGNTYKNTVLEATTDGSGNVRFDYATPTYRSGPSAKTNKTETVKYEVRHGAVDGKTFGINWSKVNSISGNTYDLRSEAKENGLKWDNGTKTWRRK